MSQFPSNAVNVIDPVPQSAVQSAGIASGNLNEAANRSLQARLAEMQMRHEAEKAEFLAQKQAEESDKNIAATERMQKAGNASDLEKQKLVNQSFRDTANIEAQNREKLQTERLAVEKALAERQQAIDKEALEHDKATQRLNMQMTFGLKKIDIDIAKEQMKSAKQAAMLGLENMNLMYGAQKSEKEFAQMLTQTDRAIEQNVNAVNKAYDDGVSFAEAANADLDILFSNLETAEERNLNALPGIAEGPARFGRALAEGLGVRPGPDSIFASDDPMWSAAPVIKRAPEVVKESVETWAKGLTDAIVATHGSKNPDAIKGAIVGMMQVAEKAAARLDPENEDLSIAEVQRLWEKELSPYVSILGTQEKTALTTVFTAFEALARKADEKAQGIKMQMADPSQDLGMHMKLTREENLEALNKLRTIGGILNSAAHGKVQKKTDMEALRSAVQLRIATKGDDEDVVAYLSDENVAKDFVMNMLSKLPLEQMEQVQQRIALIEAQQQQLDWRIETTGLQGESRGLDVESEAFNMLSSEIMSQWPGSK